ncbi:MAG: hypothetical protein ACE5QF_00455 [Thermoplasmata archaeon]
MKIGKFQIGAVLAIICIAILASSLFLPWWTIERREKSPTMYPSVYVNSTHEFRLLSISSYNKDTTLGVSNERRWDTSYADIQNSGLDTHFLVMLALVTTAMILILLSLVLYHLSRSRQRLRMIALVVGFAVIFLVLGSAAYLHAKVPPAVGDSRVGLGSALDTILPNIQTFADTDLNETPTMSVTTTWGPSIGWHIAFVVCVIMLFSIWFMESRPKEED